jgi:hypothetical protein
MLWARCHPSATADESSIFPIILGGKIFERILKNPRKRGKKPQKYIKKMVLRGVNQNPLEEILFKNF